MAEKSMIGMDLGKGSIEVEKGRLRFFAKATGETNPVCTDEAAARDAGHRSLPVPPTSWHTSPNSIRKIGKVNNAGPASDYGKKLREDWKIVTQSGFPGRSSSFSKLSQAAFHSLFLPHIAV